VIQAAAWAALAASTLLVGAWFAVVFRATDRALGLVMGFGAGALIAAVAFELTEEAFARGGGGPLVMGLAAGALAYFVGDRAIDRTATTHREQIGRRGSVEGRALLLGVTLDAVPESLIIGLSLIGGGSVELAFLVSVAVSNVPRGSRRRRLSTRRAFRRARSCSGGSSCSWSRRSAARSASCCSTTWARTPSPSRRRSALARSSRW
jgi:zinc transporter ZupT